MTETVQTTVVGAGVLGCAVARELAQAGDEVFVLEKNPGVTRGENQSSRNSGVIHAGLYYDRQTRPLKARLCAQGNQMLYDFCRRYDLPHLRCGKLVVAANPRELPVLEMYLERARQNQVEARLIDRDQAAALEPMVRAEAALLLPSAGIIDPTALVRQLYALASADGAQFLTDTELTAAQLRPGGVELTVRYRDGATDNFLTKRLVNCAGLYADQVAAMLDPGSPHRIDPMRGEAARFYRTRRPELHLAGMNVYPTPYQVALPQGTYWTVGVHLTPTLEPKPGGGWDVGPVVTVGPLNFSADSREDYGEPFRPMSEFLAQVNRFFPGLSESDLEPHQVGVQARLAGHQDWLLSREPGGPRCLHLLGTDSPGLTSCLALARQVRSMLEEG